MNRARRDGGRSRDGLGAVQYKSVEEDQRRGFMVRRNPSRRSHSSKASKTHSDPLSDNAASQSDIEATLGQESDYEPAHEKDLDYTGAMSSGDESESPTPRSRRASVAPSRSAKKHQPKSSDKSHAHIGRPNSSKSREKSKESLSGAASGSDNERFTRCTTPKPAGKRPKLAPKTVYTPPENETESWIEAAAQITPTTPLAYRTRPGRYDYQNGETPEGLRTPQSSYHKLIHAFGLSKTPTRPPKVPPQMFQSKQNLAVGPYPIQDPEQDVLNGPNEDSFFG